MKDSALIIPAVLALWLLPAPAWAATAETTAEPAADEQMAPPLHLQLQLEFFPKLAEHGLPAAIDPQRIRILIDSDTPRPISLISDGTITVNVDFADAGEATIAGPFRLDHRPMRLSSEALTLQAGALAPYLPQPLQWRGQADYDQDRLQIAGTLALAPTLAPELAVEHQILISGGLTGAEAQFRLPEINLPLAGLPFMARLPWPDPMPELEAGRLSGQVNLTHPEDQWQLSGQLQLQATDGIYQTAFFHDLNLGLPFRLEQDMLILPDLDLTIREFNPGIALGPVRAEGHYRAPVADPAQGRLEVTKLTAGILGGLFLAEPFSFAPGQEDFHFDLRVEGLELDQLLAVHPVEGLSGTGRIDGRLPLRWQDGSLTLSDGRLTVRSPGGVLTYESDASAAMARRNPALKLLLDALSNFHYNVLTAEVSYLESGNLLLGLRLEGSNPEVERGRPMVLEINLEENLPALLAGLQLTNRISDTIRQRIEERYR